MQVVVAHKPSDLLTVGDADSQAVAIAKDLMHLCATKVLLGQDEKIGEELSELLGLSPMGACGHPLGDRGEGPGVVDRR